MARKISIWERLRESTEGPTVTVAIPREWAEELLRSLATALEVEDMGDDLGDGEMDGMPSPHMEPDEDDLGGMPDFDSDDLGMMSPGGADDSDDESDDDDADEDDSDDEEDDDDDDEEDEQDESAGSVRPQTALGERFVRVGRGRPRTTGPRGKKPRSR